MAQPTPKQQQPLFKGRIGYADEVSARNDLIFQYNPQTVEWSRSATYSTNNAALADFPNASASSKPAFWWIRNPPETASFELFFHEDGNKTIEPYLKKLDDLMKPSPTTGRPRILFMSWGMSRRDLVAIMEKNVKGTLANRAGEWTEARVTIKLGLYTSRSTR